MGATIIPHPVMGQASPQVGQLVQRVHALSADSANVRMGIPHFQESLVDHRIDMRSVLEVLRNGRVIGLPELDQFGDWRIRMTRKVAGRRVVVVVAVSEDADHVECITAW